MSHEPSRRAFLKLSAAAMAASSVKPTHAASGAGRFAIVADNSALIRADPIQYALSALREAVTTAHLTDDDSAAELRIYIAPPDSLLVLVFFCLFFVLFFLTVALIPGTHKG